MPDEKHHLMRTYLVRHCETHELVGYFSLKAGLISCDETKQQGAILFNTIPGVELANFAVNECFVAKTGIRGIGKTIFSELILPLVREEAKNIGIFLIYIFALPYPHLLKAYQNYGFSRLKAEQEKQLHTRLKPRYDKACIFMFYPLHSIDNPQH